MKRKSISRFAQHGGHSRTIAFLAYRAVRLVLWVVMALGSLFWINISEFAHAQTLSQGVLTVGVSPTSMNTGNFTPSQAIHFDTQFFKNLKANTPFLRCIERRELPEKSGNQHKLYMYQTLGANIAQAGEGVVGSGITVTVLTNAATIGQFADYVNFSDLSLQTAIDPSLENTEKEMAYRLALTVNLITRNVADGLSAIDSSVNANNKPFNVPFGKSDVTTNIQSLAGRNVMPFTKGKYCGVIHPFIVGDTVNDSSNNSLTDVLKHTVEGQMKLEELPAPEGDEVQVMDWGGATFYQSTIVTQTANYQSSGKTALRTYIFGEDALIGISLGKKEGAMIGNGDWRNMNLWRLTFDTPSRSDPSRMIGGLTSYNVKWVVTTPPDTTMRARTIDAVSNIS